MTECVATIEPLPTPSYLLRIHQEGDGVGTPYAWACIIIALNGWEKFLAENVSAELLPIPSYLLRVGKWTCILIDMDGGQTVGIEGMGGIAPTLAEARAVKATIKAAGFIMAKWRRRKGTNSFEVIVKG